MPTQATLLRRLGGQPLLPALLLRRRPTRPRAGVVAFALALLLAVLALRLTVTSSDPLLIFGVLPVALLALEAGTRGGIAGATVGVVSIGLWSVVADVELSALGYLTRVSTLFLVGVLLGYLADHLSRARDAQKLLLDLAPEGTLALDLDGRVIIANAAAEDLFGYGPDELVGQPVERLVPGFFGALERSLRERTIPEDAATLTACSKDGGVVGIRGTVEALASDAGALLVRLRGAQEWPEVIGASHGFRI
jgi:PAS domain S-box-containing protein